MATAPRRRRNAPGGGGGGIASRYLAALDYARGHVKKRASNSNDKSDKSNKSEESEAPLLQTSKRQQKPSNLLLSSLPPSPLSPDAISRKSSRTALTSTTATTPRTLPSNDLSGSGSFHTLEGLDNSTNDDDDNDNDMDGDVAYVTTGRLWRQQRLYHFQGLSAATAAADAATERRRPSQGDAGGKAPEVLAASADAAAAADEDDQSSLTTKDESFNERMLNDLSALSSPESDIFKRQPVLPPPTEHSRRKRPQQQQGQQQQHQQQQPRRRPRRRAGARGEHSLVDSLRSLFDRADEFWEVPNCNAAVGGAILKTAARNRSSSLEPRYDADGDDGQEGGRGEGARATDHQKSQHNQPYGLYQSDLAPIPLVKSQSTDAKSDIMSAASTQIATNRAVDVAIKLIRGFDQMGKRDDFVIDEDNEEEDDITAEGQAAGQAPAPRQLPLERWDEDSPSLVPTQSTSSADATSAAFARNTRSYRLDTLPSHPVRYAFGRPKVHPSQLETTSLLSVSSAEESSLAASQSNAANSILLNQVTDEGNGGAIHQRQHRNSHPIQIPPPQQRQRLGAVPLTVEDPAVVRSRPPKARRTGRLGNHMERQSAKDEQILLRQHYRETTPSIQSASRTSSVGVEINLAGDEEGADEDTANLAKSHWNSSQNRKAILSGLALSTRTDDLLIPELAVADAPRPNTVAAAAAAAAETQRTKDIETKTFVLKKGKVQGNVASAENDTSMNKLNVSTDSNDTCLSPPPIVRSATASQGVYTQSPSLESPDPIFCSKSPSTVLSPQMTATSGQSSSVGVKRYDVTTPNTAISTSGHDSESPNLSERATISVGSRPGTNSTNCSILSSDIPGTQTTSTSALSSFIDNTPASRRRAAAALPSAGEMRKTGDHSPDSIFCFQSTTSSHKQGDQSQRSVDVDGGGRFRAVGVGSPESSEETPRGKNLQDGYALHRQHVQRNEDLASNPSRDAPTSGRSEAVLRRARERKARSSFLAAISKFEKHRQTAYPTSSALVLEDEEEKTAYGKNELHAVKRSSRLESHFSSQRDVGFEDPTFSSPKPVDVQSLKSAFESHQTSPDTSYKDDDDDTVSVKSLRERFEVSPRKADVEAENKVKKMRALFEPKTSSIATRFGANRGPLKQEISRFNFLARRSNIVPPVARRQQETTEVSQSSEQTTETEDVAPANLASAPENVTNSSVSDRIRALASRTHASSRTVTPSSSNANAKASKASSHSNSRSVNDKIGTAETFRDRVSKFSITYSGGMVDEVEISAATYEYGEDLAVDPEDEEDDSTLEPVVLDYSPDARIQTKKNELKRPPAPQHVIKPQAIKPNGYRSTLFEPRNVIPPDVFRERSFKPSDSMTDNPEKDLQLHVHVAEDRKAESPTHAFPIDEQEDKLQANRPTEQISRSHTVPAVHPPKPPSLVSPARKTTGRTTTEERTLYYEDDENGESSESGSDEFSDGVTLDLSIAEVSNLTNPTALISRTGERSVATDAGESSDRSARSVDMIESEAKRSEASSSQTSEAAAPLIAKAMRMRPMSDEMSVSVNSFFAKRALIANHWSKTSGWDNNGNQRDNGIEELDEDGCQESSCQEASEGSGDSARDSYSSGWDPNRVQECFPVTKSSASEDIFEFESEWELFPAQPTSSSADVAGNPESKSTTSSSYCSRGRLGNVSRSTTPTRSNTTSARPSPVVAQLRQNLPDSAAFDHPAAPKPVVASRSTSSTVFTRTHPHRQDQRRTGGGSSAASTRRSEKPYNQHIPASSIERLPVRLPQSQHRQQHANGAAGATTSTAGQHAALMAKLRALKEARLRRMAGLARSTSLSGASSRGSSNHSRFDADNNSNSTGTKSSTQFGGSTFLASLEVD